MTTTLSAFLAIGLASHLWRMSLMVNNPERYERFHRFELEFAKLQDAAGRRMAAEGKRAIGWLIRKVTKRK
jgi:hypothetical protein